MRNFSLGIGRRDLMFFTGATILMIVLTIAWDLLLADVIIDQSLNKYFLTLVVFALAGVIAFVTSVAGGMQGGLRGMLPGLMTRFGLALQIFGVMIIPIGLYYATNPTRSVPVGFAAFGSVIIGIIIAGIGGNMLVQRRA